MFKNLKIKFRRIVGSTGLNNRGFVLFMSLLVSSIMLTAGLFISRIIIRQISLATIQRDSQKAFFAADAGLECGRYWKDKGTGEPKCNERSADTSSGILKTTADSAALRRRILDASELNNSNNIEFSFDIGGQNISGELFPKSCVVITVCKDGLGTGDCLDSTAPSGKIISRGYNVECDPDTGRPIPGRTIERKLTYIYR